MPIGADARPPRGDSLLSSAAGAGGAGDQPEVHSRLTTVPSSSSPAADTATAPLSSPTRTAVEESNSGVVAESASNHRQWTQSGNEIDIAKNISSETTLSIRGGGENRTTSVRGLSVFNISALRSRLRQHQLSRSAGSRSSISSAPVLVRSYSRPTSIYSLDPTLYRQASSMTSAGSGQLAAMASAAQSNPLSSLPPVSEFSFSHVLLTVSPDIQDALDAISEICARSRYSLADEYGAHLPPTGEIRLAALQHLPLARGRQGLFVRTAGLADSALSVVQEASSSSSVSGSDGGRRSAYGSLRGVLSGSKTRGKRKVEDRSQASGKNEDKIKSSHQGDVSWAVKKDGNESIVIARPKASRQISMDPVIEQSRGGDTLEPISASSWIPWKSPSPSPVSTSDVFERPTAESSLKSLLIPPSLHAQGIT
jgi:hypothetical protein